MDQGTQPTQQMAAARTPRRVTETKQAFKTTEFWVYLVAVLAVLIAGLAAGGDETSADGFGADRVWLYVTLLTIGYLVSRGLSKAGSHDPDTDGAGAGGGESSIGDRVKAAAQVLKEGDTGSHQATPPTGERRGF